MRSLESRHVRITSWGAVNVYAHVTSREHREDKRTTRPDTYKHSPRRGTHITINVGLAQARPNYINLNNPEIVRHIPYSGKFSREKFFANAQDSGFRE